jgi:inorganic triphosphatase YgiF
MTEIELKLTPLDDALLDRLAAIDRLGRFEVVGRRHEQQRNSFFDTPTRALRKHKIGFRRRVVEGERMATWTLKAEGGQAGGVASRPEVELVMDPDMPPALVLQALRQRGQGVLAEQLGDALADGSLPLAKPYLEMATDRHILDLQNEKCRAELALDRVTIPGEPYAESEIEVELKRGDEAALSEARAAIEAMGAVNESIGSKLSRAIDYVERSARSSR